MIEALKTALANDSRFIDENGNLLRSAVVNAALSMDAKLIQVLASAPELKANFFTHVDGIEVFDKQKFIWAVESKEFLPDSYTRFRNKVGLADSNGRFVSSSNDVSLVWPFADCILEGGMTHEEGERKEIFYNETLAPDQITALLEPKALKRAIRYTKDGAMPAKSFDPDRDNLILRGNNLQALTTLKANYENGFELIYIDPPYNTGDDSFRYNDRFSRSTWLTFMKNRVEQAVPLMSENGVLAIQISFHQGAYLQVLLDQVAGIHHLMSMHVLVRHPDRSLTGDKSFNDVMEMVLLYSKSPNRKMPKKVTPKDPGEYGLEVEIFGEGQKEMVGGKEVTIFQPNEWRLAKVEPNASALKSISIRGSLREGNSSGRFYVAHIEPQAGSMEPTTLIRVPGIGDDGRGYRYFMTPKKGNKNGTYFQGMPQSSSTTETPYANFQNFVDEFNNVAGEVGVSFRKGKKPEKLIAFLIELFTVPGQKVLDYHLGSGTTAAVAHKMGRRYVGVEQMDYIETLAVDRLQQVIAGETTGISGEVNWQGGGEFVYCEMAELNEKAMQEIQEAQTTDELLSVLDQLVQRGLLRPEVLPSSLQQNLGDFEELSFGDQQRIVAEVVNKNRLYIPYLEIDDPEYALLDEDKAFTRSFFGLEAQ